MSTLDEIEAAISQLSDEDRASLRHWFFELEAGQWDIQIEQDICAGQLDHLADQALEQIRNGRCSPL